MRESTAQRRYMPLKMLKYFNFDWKASKGAEMLPTPVFISLYLIIINYRFLIRFNSLKWMSWRFLEHKIIWKVGWLAEGNIKYRFLLFSLIIIITTKPMVQLFLFSLKKSPTSKSFWHYWRTPKAARRARPNPPRRVNMRLVSRPHQEKCKSD